MNTVLQVLRLRYNYNNRLEQQQARGLFTIAVSMFALVLSLVLVAVFAVQPFTLSVVIINTVVTSRLGILLMGLLAASAVVLVLLNRGRLGMARLVFVGALYLFGAVLLLLIGISGPRSWATAYLIVPVVAAGILLRRTGLVTIALLCALTVLLLELFTRLGLLTYPPLEVAYSSIGGILPVTLVVTIMLYVLAGGQRSLLQQNLNLTGELTGLTALSRALSMAETLDDMLMRMVEVTRDHLGYYSIQLFLLEEKTGVLSLAAGTGLLGTEREAQPRRIVPDADSALFQALDTGQTVLINADAPEARRKEFLPATRSQALIALRRSDEIIGVLDVQSVQANAFDSSDVEALEAIASQIALSIQNGRYAAALRDANRDRQTLADQVRANTREIERLNQELSGRAWVHYLESRTEKLVGFDYTPEGTVSSAYTPMSIPERSPHGWTPRIESRDGVQTLVVPIVSRGQALGAMEFRAAQGQIWDDRSVELARAIAQRLALSLDNLRLFEQAQMAVAREQMANQIATLLQAKSDVDSLVAVAVDAFQQALGAVQTSIRLGIPEGTASPEAALSSGSKPAKQTTSPLAGKNGENRS